MIDSCWRLFKWKQMDAMLKKWTKFIQFLYVKRNSTNLMINKNALIFFKINTCLFRSMKFAPIWLSRFCICICICIECALNTFLYFPEQTRLFTTFIKFQAIKTLTFWSCSVYFTNTFPILLPHLNCMNRHTKMSEQIVL